MEKTPENTLTITEIYASIQGESSFAGLPCVFIRLTGCPLRCSWCDTVYGFHGGQVLSMEQILDQTKAFGISLVELTGGEPLAQAGCIELSQRLIEGGYRVLIETSGSEDISKLPKDVHIIMDLKPPGSKMSDRNRFENIEHLKTTDEVKFVCASKEDYDWSKEIIDRFKLADKSKILMSCAFGLLAPKDLAAWMVEDKLSARLNLQQHKYIWHPRAKGV